MAWIAQDALRPTALRLAAALALLAGPCATVPALAQDSTELTLTVKDHKFDPAQLEAPANKPIVLRVKNLDPTPMEFESNSLRVEKVLTGNGEAVVNIRPQKAGQYEFFDDFHASTTKGILVVK
jgi:ABC-type sugar transport system substrate-binding protein